MRRILALIGASFIAGLEVLLVVEQLLAVVAEVEKLGVAEFDSGLGAELQSSASRTPTQFHNASYLVDPASSHMLVSKIKPCMSKYKPH